MQASMAKVLLMGLLASFAPSSAAQEDEATAGPVGKVVRLLEELSQRIEKDEAEEQQTFNRYACWCEKTTQRKSEAIADARKTLSRLGNEILSLKGLIATRASEIAELKANIEENLATQKTMTVIRQRENAAFLAETAEMKQAIAALEKAIIVLRDATAPVPAAVASFAEVYSSLKKMSSLHTSLSTSQLALVHRFTSKSSTSYAPQSATVQGILKDMYDTFTADLESAHQEEASRARNYESLIATKQKELITLRDSLAKKEASKAEAETMLADATQSYADTEEQLKADVAFFDATKEACEAKTQQWGQRQAMRQQELTGIEKALEILTDPEANKLFDRSIKAGIKTGTFLQLSASDMAAPVANACKALQSSARKVHSLRLAALAATVSTTAVGHFDAVISAIDTMIADLQQEGQQDIQQRDQCKDDLHNIAVRSGKISWEIEKNNAKILKLENLVVARTAEKEKTIEDIQNVGQEIGEMETQRKSENQEFLKAKGDDEKAIELLEQAKAALQQYFEKNDIELGPISDTRHTAALAQRTEPAPIDEDAPPDARLSKKGSRKVESKGVISILAMIIEDLQDEIKEGRSGEEAAQLDFEKRLAAAQKLREELVDKKTNLEGTIAQRDQEISDEQGTLSENVKDLDDEKQLEKDTKPNCDQIEKNFSDRATKRAIEVQGLTTAKAYLAGQQATVVSMSQTGQYQHQGRFDDDKFGQINFKAMPAFLPRL